MNRSEQAQASNAAELRRRAEARYEERHASEPHDPRDDPRRLLHELEVHKIELELQNDELVRTRRDVEAGLHRYTQIFDFAPVGYFVLTSEGDIREANFAAARLLGEERTRLIGRSFASFLSEAHLDALKTFLSRVLTSDLDESESCELRLEAAPSPLDVRLTGTVLQASPPWALVAVEDVTARKLADALLREQGRRKDDFLTALSHELRNPLSAVHYSLHVLDRSDPGSEAARQAREILERQVAHLSGLVDDLLDLTRVARGKIELQLERVDLGEIARRTVDDHQPAYLAQGIDLSFGSSRDDLWVDGDSKRLVQVLSNLLGNALKFTGRSGHVEVRLSRYQQEAVLSVRDDGAGIAPEMLPHLFTPFSQAPQTLDRSRGGLGLGLAMVKGLVELHRGLVEVRSGGPGAGSTFTVRLPLQKPGARPAAAAATAKSRQPRRVLVIEDNRDVADSLVDLLQLRGHEAHVAYDGPSGIERAREVRPDVVMCDIGLPGMDGYEVARAIRQEREPAVASTTLIALSGYGSAEDVLRSTDAGFDRHVTKPPAIDTLEAAMAECASVGGGGAGGVGADGL
jgi:two-component system CheB/CheR fusion protein